MSLEQAMALAKEGRYKEAAFIFHETGGAEASYGEGACLYRMGRIEEARKALQECLNLDPLHAKAQLLLSQLPPPGKGRKRKSAKAAGGEGWGTTLAALGVIALVVAVVAAIIWYSST